MKNREIDLFNNCSETSNKPEIVFKERKSKITFKNTLRKRVTKVDVACLKLDGKSCDGLLIEGDRLSTDFEHFVELKGNHVKTAIRQIEETIKKISFDPKNLKKRSYISSTKSPKIDTTMQNIKKHLKDSYNSELIIKTGHLIYKF
jgi:hypothetical protein